MNKRILSLCLALALCLSFAPATVFAGAPLKTYTETPTALEASTVSMMDNGFGSFKFLDADGNIISKGVITPDGNVPVFREAAENDPDIASGTHYASAGGYIVDLQPVTLSAKDGSSSWMDHLIFTEDGRTVYYLTELIRHFDGLSGETSVYTYEMYFGNDGYLTACTTIGGSNAYAYIIDLKTLTLKTKFDLGPVSQKVSDSYIKITSVNEGLIAFDKAHRVWESGGNARTEHDAAGWIDLSGILKLSIDTKTYANWYNFASGRAMVQNEASKRYGYADNTGKLVIPCKYRNGTMFREGYAYVCDEDGRYGYIDTAGKTAIPFQYEDAYGYGSGLFAVGHAAQYGYKYGMVDKNNREVVPIVYDDISRAYGDHAYAVKNGKLVILSFKDDPEAAKDVTNIFPDVLDNAWYVSHLQVAYDNGIIGGTSSGLFVPEIKDGGSLTHAQILVMAARLRTLLEKDNYDFTGHAVAGAHWATPYLNYCKEKGITDSRYDNVLDKPVTRSEMAYYFGSVLPESYYEATTEISFPDVADDPYLDEIMRLAKSGVVGGRKDGTYDPRALVSRAESTVFIRNILNKMK